MSSNNNSIITVNNLGKRYRIGTKINPEGLDNFRDVILNTVKAPFRNLSRLRKLTNFEDKGDGEASDIIWALKDVSFEVNRGEVVGIIGRNGSGKSTLLKILSRITEPTKGCVKLRGRVSSLLEVGTGFHRELTGRENIYLNGSILGMKKWEIDDKFDEIVAFSEIEKFIDTPVKHYSSGMYVRLAFAVAAHLEPEILLVDEVLAVGDVVFQKKCLGKMSDVAKEGRTVLFVSHNMYAVRQLCERSIVLKKGSVVFDGNTEEAVAAYTDTYYKDSKPSYNPSSAMESLGVLINGKSMPSNIIWDSGCKANFSITVKSRNPIKCPGIDIAFFRQDGLKLFAIQSDRKIEYVYGTPRTEWVINFCISDTGLASQAVTFDVGARADHGNTYDVLWERAGEIIISRGKTNISVTKDSLIAPHSEVTIKDSN